MCEGKIHDSSVVHEHFAMCKKHTIIYDKSGWL